MNESVNNFTPSSDVMLMTMLLLLLPAGGRGQTWNWVIGSFGLSFTSGSPGHHFDPV